MTSYIRLLGFILTVPIIGFLVAKGIQAHFQIDLSIMSKAAVGASGVGLLLLFCIRTAGLLARRNRNLLLWVFKPGLYLTGLVLIGLVVVHAAIAMAAIYYGEAALFRRVHVYVIGGIGLGALAGVFKIARNTFSLVRKTEIIVIGKLLSRKEAPDFWGRIEGIADRLGALHPENIVLGLDPNFFVTEADVICLSGNFTGRTLYCSLPLMRILNRREFDAIIGHELGHYKGFDTKFSKKFFPIYRGTVNSIEELRETGGESPRAIALLPAIAVFSYFLESFSVAESRISRERELGADKEGATATDERTIASALVKVQAFSGFWGSLQHVTMETLRQGRMFVNLSKAYINLILAHANPDVLKGLEETHLSHPTDSHPPLKIRLKSLGVSMKHVVTDALNVNPMSPAIKLLRNPERLEEEISSRYQVILARQMDQYPDPDSDTDS